MPFTGDELEKLRADLPRGSAQKLADKFNMKVGSIRNILTGSSNNDEVILGAYELAKEYQNKIQNTKAALAQ